MCIKRLAKVTTLIWFIATVNSNSAPLYENEIIIVAKEGTVEMPPESITAGIEDVIFNPPEIAETLIGYGAETVTIAFPEYDPADTIFTTRMGTFITRKLDLHLIFKVFIGDSEKRDLLNEELLEYNEILSSQNNGTAIFSTNDPLFHTQWGLHNTGQTGGPEDIDIDAPEAWQLEQGNVTYSIGILDSGVKLNHEDLSGKVVGESFTNNCHGTHVAGIAGAWGNNHVGISGVNWNAHVVSRNMESFDYIQIYNKIIELLGYPIEAINCSWRLHGDINIVHRAFAFAHNIGVSMVAARGNFANSIPQYPAFFGEWVISVGALTHLNDLAPYSSFGAGMDFLAPGGSGDGDPYDIHSTWCDDNEPYYWLQGTSMAAPHVTGIISLIYDYSDLRVSTEFQAILKNSCIDMAQSGYDPETGWGRVNADSALKLLTFPQEIFRYQISYAEPNIHWITDQYIIKCWGWTGMPQGAQYRVKRYEVRGDLVFEDDIQAHFGRTPMLIGLGYGGGIERTEVDEESYYIRYSEIVPGMLNRYGGTLRTYIYEVWSTDNPPIYYGFRPMHPDDVTFMYTVIGNPVPDPPSNLNVSPSPNYHPLTTWNPSSSADVTSYKVYRKVHGIEPTWVHIATVPSTQHQYEDTEYDTPHIGPIAEWTDDADYTVTAYDGVGESDAPPFVTLLVVVPEKPNPVIPKITVKDNNSPSDFALEMIYPNPFNVHTTINYSLPEDQDVLIEVFDVIGAKVTTILNERKTAGYHSISWNASHLSSGVYFCRIKTNVFEDTKRFTLLK